MADLKATLKEQGVIIKTKMRLYKSLIQPIALYGCESWTLRQAEENKLNAFEMSALRKILGVKRLDKIRNEYIRARTNCTKTIVELVYEMQHKWLGHVLRMNRARIAPTVLQGKVNGKRRVGKPRTTWLKAVEERTGSSLFSSCELAKDRDVWRVCVQGVGAHVRPTRLKSTRAKQPIALQASGD
jgi:hypothetical protein